MAKAFDAFRQTAGNAERYLDVARHLRLAGISKQSPDVVGIHLR